jgi:hypothetical protein
MSAERMQTVVLRIAFSLATVFYSVVAESAIVSTTGEVSVLSAPPASVTAGGFEDNNITRVFLEKTVTLQNNLTVDNTATGDYPPNASRGIVIPAGTTISSYFFDFDPVGSSDTPPRVSTGLVTFDHAIVGVIFTICGLDTTDSLLGAPGTVYSTPAQEIETGTTGMVVQDAFTISSDRRTISFSFQAAPGQDQMRVIVAEQPTIINEGGLNFGFEDLTGQPTSMNSVWFAMGTGQRRLLA